MVSEIFLCQRFENIHDSIKGGRLIYCQECGKLVHVVKEQDRSIKFCKKCAKESMYSSQSEYYKRKKHNS